MVKYSECPIIARRTTSGLKANVLASILKIWVSLDQSEHQSALFCIPCSHKRVALCNSIKDQLCLIITVVA